ncbi:MAG: DUF4163 domain-containing protein [Eubacterium sp.]|nr:DUF4163 domain-containing protein [Eubacterium sp.]
MMKKKFICTALASVMLLCSACGKQDGALGNETIIDNTDAQENSDTAEASGAANTSAANSDTNADDSAAQADNGTSTNSGTADATAQSLSISVTFQTEENEETAEDGTTIYTRVIIYPVISIEGNETAADKINADIQTRVDDFSSNTMLLTMAQEQYQYYIEENPEYDFFEYSSDLDFTVTRCDSNVISFTARYYEYADGAHGNYTTIGVNYSSQTGELITFSELSDDPDSFYDNTLAFNQALAENEFYQEILFPNTSSETLESVLYTDGAWYLSTSGLIFFSDPYALGPYASGTIEFPIPYNDLYEMGFKEEYRYAGNLTVQIEDGASYTLDINGDGVDDTIELYTNYEEVAEGTSDFVTHLIINGIDVSQGYSEELTNALTPWPLCALYDMDASDDTVEIAVSRTLLSNGESDTDVISTYFFRYEKDGSITYLGMTRGAATDPTIDISNLTQ